MNPILEQKIIEIIEKTINQLGFELVRVRIHGGSSQILEILIDRLNGEKINIADCALVSRNISALLDVEDIIQDKYFLEVTSAGIERPLVKLTDYTRFTGREAKIKLKHKLNNCGHYRGKIIKINGEDIILLTKDGEVSVPFELIKTGNLVLTDEMFRELINKTHDQK